ncbi:PP2C family protein-serine/threonine phosphatase [Streptomyces sp. NPDC090106]|uniref:PP2C family protein-serine/threonine phosphatase n=1 Tax=Streptomyces sp. NPDC090106 TaxID=3365946 RepID=UPI003823B850
MGARAERPLPKGRQEWWKTLHGLWRAAVEEDRDVTGIASLVYEALIALPGVTGVVGARWDACGVRYVRRMRPGARSPETWMPSMGEWPAGESPAVFATLVDGIGLGLHDLGPEDRGGHDPGLRDTVSPQAAPAAGFLRETRAGWSLSCVFPLAVGDSAGLWLGLRQEPGEEERQVLSDQLTQVAEVLAASNLRILQGRSERRRQIRDAFLAEASLQMDTSLDAAETLHRIARLAVPAVAEGCLVHLLEADGDLGLVAVAHVGAAAQTWLTDVSRTEWVRNAVREGTASRESLILGMPELADGPFAADGTHPGGAVRSLSISPLRARGRTLGALTFLYRQDETEAIDLVMLGDLAGRAALAIDTTTLYEQRRRDVQSLQRHLLPRELPRPAGLELSAAYQVADPSLDVGGDFYDVVTTADRVALFIGDVCGRGAEAAAYTALARFTLRTLLEDGTGPADALSRINTLLLREGGARFVTALIVILTPVDGGWEAEVAGAGHPWPLVRRDDASVVEIPAQGPLLGVLPEPRFTSTRTRIGAGEALVLFTDGLLEARSADGTHFEVHVADAVAKTAASGEGAAAELVQAASAFRSRGDDDTAVLIAKVEG